tara:strand:- start:779 stop:1072 length:294 start_codon:yes stop_codon:yes gene_type:complete
VTPTKPLPNQSNSDRTSLRLGFFLWRGRLGSGVSSSNFPSLTSFSWSTSSSDFLDMSGAFSMDTAVVAGAESYLISAGMARVLLQVSVSSENCWWIG